MRFFGNAIFSSMKKLLFFLLLFFPLNALAAYVAVLETMADGDAKDSVSLLDRQYLTNVLREQAVKELPAKQGFTIMTRENINAMLPPGKAIEDCEGSCLAETGKNIAADYVCQARVGRFGSKLTLSAELYETAGNKLIASFNGRGADVEELLSLIESKSTEFFHAIKDLNDPVAANPSSVSDSSASTPIEDLSASPVNSGSSSVTQDPGTESGKKNTPPVSVTLSEAEGSKANSLDDKAKVGESIPANVNDEPSKKSGIAGKVVLGIGAAATVAGVVLAVVGNNKAKDAAETKRFANEDEYNDAKDKAKSGQTLRGIGIGIAIAGAVGIGVSFAF